MTNQELLSNTRELVGKERRITLKILWHLWEINRRRAFVDAGYSSLWDYVTGELKYSSGAAKRRIDAMFALGEHPELEKAVADGSLSLSTVSQVQSFVRRTGVAASERIGLFQSMAGKSTREVEKLLEPSDGIEVWFTLSPELYEKFKELQSLLAHQARSPEDVFEKLVDLGLKEHHPAREPKRARQSTSAPNSRGTVNLRGTSGSSEPATPQTRYIPAQVRREVWRKSKNRCSYLDPKTGLPCGSKHALQIDHIEPYAHGGSNDPSNLRLLCRQHNLWRAVA